MSFIINSAIATMPAKVTVDPEGMNILRQAWLPALLSIPALGILINLALKRYKTALSWLGCSAAIVIIPVAAIGFSHQLRKIFEATDNSSDNTNSINNHGTKSVTAPAKNTPNIDTKTVSSASHNSVDYSLIFSVAACIAAVIILIGLAYIIKDYVSGKRAIIAANNADKLEERQRKQELDKQLTDEWNAIIVAHDNVLRKWNAYDTNIKELLSLPAMRDFSIPEVGAVIDALDYAGDEKTLRYPVGIMSVNGTRYYQAVKQCEKAFDAALRAAINHKNKVMTNRERSQLELANQLLRTAMDNSASVNERQLAYSRVISIMEDLRIDVPQKIVVEIENNTRKLLEA